MKTFYFAPLFELPRIDTDLKIYYDMERDSDSETKRSKFSETEIAYEWMGDGTFKKR